MSRGPVARSLEELDALERQNLEAGTMGEAYSPPSNTMEAINRVAMPPEDARKAFDDGIPAHEGTTKGEDASVPVSAIHDAAKAKKSQREMLADWLKEQDAMLRGMTSERERAISDAERASAGPDQGRSIINSLAAGGSILAGNKDLAKGYMAQAGEMPGQQKAESDRKALAAWVAKQAEGLDSRGKLMQQAGEADERNAYLREALAAKPPPKEPVADPLLPLKGQKLEAEIYRLKHPATKQSAAKSQEPKEKAAPVGAIEQVADFHSGIKLMNDLRSKIPETHGLWDRSKAWAMAQIPGTDESNIDREIATVNQAVGVILEKGKMTDSDFGRYIKNAMPQVGQSPETVRSRIDSVIHALQTKLDETQKAYEGAGYKIRSAAAAPAGGAVRMVSGDGKQSEDFDPQDADLIEQAKKKGWRVAQ